MPLLAVLVLTSALAAPPRAAMSYRPDISACGTVVPWAKSSGGPRRLFCGGIQMASTGITAEFSPMAPILDLSEPLALTPQQRLTLTDIDLDFRAAAVQLLNDRELLRIAALRTRGVSDTIPAITAEQLRAIEGKTLDLKVAWLSALTRARAILSPEQQAQLSGHVRSPPSFAADAVTAEPADLDARIGDAVGKRLKDAKVVEIEVTRAIAERLFSWAKSFGLIVGVPIGLLGLVLGGLGIKSYADFSTLVGSARKEVTESIEGARKSAVEIAGQAEKLRDDYAKLQTQFGEVSTLALNVQDLSNKVQRIEEKISIQNPQALSADVQQNLENAIAQYREYFARLGYKPPSGRIEIEIDTKNSMNAYYDGKKIVIDKRMADMPDVIYRSYTHRALETVHEWGNLDTSLNAIESGLSDYFPCSYQDNPRFGVRFVQEFAASLPPEFAKRGLLRDMLNTIGLDTVVSAEAHVAGEAWSGAFWEIRGLFGRDRADALFFQTWSEKLDDKPTDTLWRRFAEVLVKKAAATMGQSEAAQIVTVFKRRGLTLEPSAARG